MVSFTGVSLTWYWFSTLVMTELLTMLSVTSEGSSVDITYWFVQLHDSVVNSLHWRHSCRVPIQGLHPSKDLAFEVFEGESERPWRAASTIVKWDGLTLGAFPVCVTRCSHPYVTISAAQAGESINLCHAMLPFSFFLSFFLFPAHKESWDMGGCEGQ